MNALVSAERTLERMLEAAQSGDWETVTRLEPGWASAVRACSGPAWPASDVRGLTATLGRLQAGHRELMGMVRDEHARRRDASAEVRGNARARTAYTRAAG